MAASPELLDLIPPLCQRLSFASPPGQGARDQELGQRACRSVVGSQRELFASHTWMTGGGKNGKLYLLKALPKLMFVACERVHSFQSGGLTTLAFTKCFLIHNWLRRGQPANSAGDQSLQCTLVEAEAEGHLKPTVSATLGFHYLQRRPRA